MATSEAEEPPTVKVEPDTPDMEETMFRVAKAMEEGLHDPGGYHLEITKWGPPAWGRVKVSRHVPSLGRLLEEMTWIGDILAHFGAEEAKE